MQYKTTPQIELLLRALERPSGKIRAALLEGAAGAGKTALTEYAAELWGAQYVYALLHSWSDDSELFVGVDVAAAVAGDAESVRLDGVLARAARASQVGTTVLCLDEVDKVPERTEMLLLDFLQSGRVPVAPSVQLQADLNNLVVFLTSNATRDLGDAFMRRVRRVRMPSMSNALMLEIISETTEASAAVAALTLKAAREVATAERNPDLSVQEVVSLVRDIIDVAQSHDDVVMLLAQWAARTAAGEQFAKTKASTAPIWGQVNRERR